MAVLEHDERGVRFPLISRTLVGRSHACFVRLSSPRVSSVHAELSWDGQHWFVHDLGSRNGTYLSGRALEPRQRIQLSKGAELTFGSRSERFVLVEDSCPTLVAEGDDGRYVSGPASMLCLPSEDEPEVTVLRGTHGQWHLETNDGTKAITEQTIVEAGGTYWKVYVPGGLDVTLSSEEQSLDTKSVALQFQVSRDEEHVTMTIEHDGRTISLPPRAHDFFLLTLARARLDDQARPDVEAAEHGWVYRQDIIRQLKIERHLLNLWTHRARRQFAEAGLLDPANLIERRPRAEQIRLGIANVRVSRG